MLFSTMFIYDRTYVYFNLKWQHPNELFILLLNKNCYLINMT